MTKILTTILFTGIYFLNAQSLINDNFSNLNLGNFRGQNNWTSATPSLGAGLGECFSPASCYVQVVNKTMTSPSVGFGNATKAAQSIAGTTGEAPGKFLSTPVNSGSLYVSLLVNFTEPTSGTTNTQVFRMMDNGFNAATRLYTQRTGTGQFKFGIDKNGSGVSQTSSTYSYGTDMLVVLKYDFIAGSNNDEVKLFVNPDLAALESSNIPVLSYTNASFSDVSTITRIVFTWSVTSQTTSCYVGAVVASTQWGTVLPSPFVKNISLNKTNASKATLNWNVENNNHLENFIVQHSTNNIDYTNVARINYAGENSFSQQLTLTEGINYIRLASLNKKGEINYSQVFTAKYGTFIQSSLHITPNPTKGNVLVSLKIDKTENITFTISDLQGRVVAQQSRKLEKGENTISIDASNLKAGNYILKTIVSDTPISQLFIKE